MSKPLVSFRGNLRADWQHLQNLQDTMNPLRFWHLLHPRFAHIVLLRASLSAKGRGLSVLSKLLSLILFFAYRIELNTNAEIGPGLVLPHPTGIVIGAHRIGARVVIFQNVTLGAKSLNFKYDPALRPHLGDDVSVGSGAVIVGGVSIGKCSIVAANSLVTRDVDENMLSIGVPARCKPIIRPLPEK